MAQYDPWRPDAPIPPDIFDYIGEWVARIISMVIVFVLMGHFGMWLKQFEFFQPSHSDFAHWLVGWF